MPKGQTGKGQFRKKSSAPPQLSPDAYKELLDLRDAEFARRDFRKFIPFMYKVLEPDLDYKEHIVTAAICEHLQAVSNKQISRLLISCPPQFGKSNIASVAWSDWDWIDNPTRRFLNVSFKMTLASKFSIDALKLWKSEWYQKYFALPANSTLVKDTEEYFETSL